jgi:HEAT repeat protein
MKSIRYKKWDGSQKPFDLNVSGALKKLMVDPVPVVKQATAASIGAARLEELVPELTQHLEAPHVRTRAIAHGALRRIS